MYLNKTWCLQFVVCKLASYLFLKQTEIKKEAKRELFSNSKFVFWGLKSFVEVSNIKFWHYKYGVVRIIASLGLVRKSSHGQINYEFTMRRLIKYKFIFSKWLYTCFVFIFNLFYLFIHAFYLFIALLRHVQ